MTQSTLAASEFDALTGGTVSAVAIPSAGTGTGNRLPDATVCSALNGAASPGVSLANPCNPAGVYGSVNVGAAPNSAAPQSFSASLRPRNSLPLLTCWLPLDSRATAGSLLSSPNSLPWHLSWVHLLQRGLLPCWSILLNRHLLASLVPQPS